MQTAKLMPNQYFKLHNGQIIKSLNELMLVLSSMDDQLFNSHASKEKNDFASWISGVHGLKDLSQKLLSTQNKQEYVRLIKAHLMQTQQFSQTQPQHQFVPQKNVQPSSPVQKTVVTNPNTGNQITQNKWVQQNNHPNQANNQQSNGSETKQVHQVAIKPQEPKKNNEKPVQNSQHAPKYAWNSTQKKTEEKVRFVKESDVSNKIDSQKNVTPQKVEIKNNTNDVAIKNTVQEQPSIKKESETVADQKKDSVVQKPVSTPKKNPKLSEADQFFQENPVLVDHHIEAKQQTLKTDPLELLPTIIEDAEKQLQLFRDKYAKAYERLSLLRKKGFDTGLAQIMLFRIPPKIKIYEASGDKKDAVLVKRYLNEVIDELLSLHN